MFFEYPVEFMDRVEDVLFFLGSRAHQFSAGEQEYDDFGLVHAVDQTRELFGLVHGSSKSVRRLFKVDHPAEAHRRHYVLYLELGLADDYYPAFL